VDLGALAAETVAQRRMRAPPIGPQEIGLGRSLSPSASKVVDGASLAWSDLEDGGKLAVVRIRSPGAQATRGGAKIYAMPDAAEIVFFAPDRPEAEMFRVTGAEINATLARDRAQRDADDEASVLYWTPIVPGEVLGIEIYLPPGVAPSELRAGMEIVSHVYETMVASASCPFGVGMGCSERCNLDASCYHDSWGQVIPAVAKMAFTTESGATSVCTGTLVTDQDPDTQVPYFLTARHCIATQAVASTLQTYWFFESGGCSGATPRGYRVVTGGSVLLDTLPEVDVTLLRLTQPPPEGVTMAGWDADTVPLGRSVSGIHHPSGDMKKVSFGVVTALEFCELPTVGVPSFPEGSFFCNPAADGGYWRVTYADGTTEGGSSGSGVFLHGSGKLVGTLTGGNASCSNQGGSNFYGRFDLAYRNGLSRWLGADGGCDAPPGSWAHCTNPACGPCALGQGDCDTDDECRPGLVCASNVGESHGFEPTVDVCQVPTDQPAEPGAQCGLALGDWDYCADPSCGPCAADEGDCDSDSECQAGLACLDDTGARRGLEPTVDLCGRPSADNCPLSNGDWAFCSEPGCGPCAVGQGDCDSDADCNPGLVCAFNQGAKYGLPGNMDVCEPRGEAVCLKAVGDWGYCADPLCGPCDEGQGDCDSDAECAAGLVCSFNSGEGFNLPSNMDVCVTPPSP
jgi:hypothetical protein